MYERLQKLHLCVSHATTIRMFDKLGQNFDSEVFKWKEELESKVLNNNQVDAHEATQVCIVLIYMSYLLDCIGTFHC